MKKMKTYTPPAITILSIDNSISLAMVSEIDPFDPDNPPWGRDSNNDDVEDGMFENPFGENPFHTKHFGY